MVKKILSVFLALIVVLALFVPICSAAEAQSFDDTSVESDLKGKYSDLYNQFPANASDTDVYLIEFFEYGFHEKTGISNDDFGLYLYVYNPSGKDITGDMASVQFGTKWGLDENNHVKAIGWRKYELVKLSANENNTLIKYKVKSPDKSMHCYDASAKTRRYEISGIELQVNQFDAEEYTVGYSYTFGGFAKGCSEASKDKSTLTCSRSDILTIVVEAHQVSYLTGNSAKGAGYSNQVNSVYFSLPKEIEEQYGDLYSIKYEYNHFYTKPIFITDNYDSYKTLHADAGKSGGSLKYQIYERAYTEYVWSDTTPPINTAIYHFFWRHLGPQMSNQGFLDLNHYYYMNSIGSLGISFLDADGWSRNDIIISADELEAAFKSYTLSYGSDKYVCGYASELFDLANSKYYQTFTKTVDEQFSLGSYGDTHNWFETWADFNFGAMFDPELDKGIYEAEYIEKLTSSSFVSDDVEHDLLVQDTYLSDLSSFYTKASSVGDNVYLLRYAAADNYFSCDMVSPNLEGDFLMFQGNVYLDFDFIEFAFKRDNKITVIPAVSNPTDGFFDVMDTSPDKNPGLGLFGSGDDDNNGILKVLLFFIEELIHDIVYPRFKRFYAEYRYNRGDTCLFVYILHNVISWYHNYYVRMSNLFGCNVLDVSVESQATDGELVKAVIHLLHKKVYSDKFSTDCYRGFSEPALRETSVGLDDYAEYESSVATLDELHYQNSYFIRDLENI